MSDAMIAALLAERARHERFGRPRRVKLVDAELAKLGHKVETVAAKPPEKPSSDRPETTAAAKPPENTAVTKPPDHVCEDCGRKFGSAAALGSHQRTHRD